MAENWGQYGSREGFRDWWMGGAGDRDRLKSGIQGTGIQILDEGAGRVRLPNGEELDLGIGWKAGGGKGQAGWTQFAGGQTSKDGQQASSWASGGSGGSGGAFQTPDFTNRYNELYEQLRGRSKQALALDRNDPIIRSQADAYAANEERARRNMISDLAERGNRYGTGAQLGTERMTAERAGQRTGAFEAQLLGRELESRRAEITHALDSMRGMLSQEQQLQMQKELAEIDAAVRRYGIDSSAQTARDQLGFNIGDREAYWDWMWNSGQGLGE